MRCNFHRRRKTVAVRRIVLLSFFILAVAIARASIASAAPSKATALVFDFSPSISESFWQTVTTALVRTDLSGSVGHPVLLVQRKRVQSGMEFFDVVQIALNGDCSAGRDSAWREDRGPLGWVYLVDGRIQPFVFVDCNQIARILQPELRGKTVGERQHILACAVSHVIVHELAHIATQDPGHEKTGPQKPYLTRGELISDASNLRDSMRRMLAFSPREAAAGSTRISPVGNE